MSEVGRIGPLGGGLGSVSGTPLLGQTGNAASLRAAGGANSATTAGAPASDQSSFSSELSDPNDGAAANLLAAWGAGPSATSPGLQVSGVEPGAQAGAVSVNGKVNGLEPGMQAGAVMMGPSLRS